MELCGFCDLTVSKLKLDDSLLKKELMEKDKLILEFSTVAATQSKHLSILGSASGNAPVDSHLPRSLVCGNNNTTHLLSGSMAAGGDLASASVLHLREDIWLSLRVKPKFRSCSTPSMPEPWNRVKSRRSCGSLTTQPRTSEVLQLENKFQALENLGCPPSPTPNGCSSYGSGATLEMAHPSPAAAETASLSAASTKCEYGILQASNKCLLSLKETRAVLLVRSSIIHHVLLPKADSQFPWSQYKSTRHHRCCFKMYSRSSLHLHCRRTHQIKRHRNTTV